MDPVGGRWSGGQVTTVIQFGKHATFSSSGIGLQFCIFRRCFASSYVTVVQSLASPSWTWTSFAKPSSFHQQYIRCIQTKWFGLRGQRLWGSILLFLCIWEIMQFSPSTFMSMIFGIEGEKLNAKVLIKWRITWWLEKQSSFDFGLGICKSITGDHSAIIDVAPLLLWRNFFDSRLYMRTLPVMQTILHVHQV